MALTPPSTLSPSKVSSFKDCALAFRYSSVDLLPEPPSEPATKGSLVHRALEHLFEREPADRTVENARQDLATAIDEFSTDPEFLGLELDDEAAAKFFAEAGRLVERYFDLEDPTTVHPIGLELKLEATVDGLRLRGIIDRLEIDPDGGLVVTDYKTGRSPGTAHTQGRLGGVTFYALLCEELFGVLPAKVQLLYLGDRTTITTTPTAQATRGLRKKIEAMWRAITLACEKEDFRPRPGPLCAWCGYQAYCPAKGGNPDLVPVLLRERADRATDEADGTSALVGTEATAS
ncbi:MAG: PD-(D/E)XK nuclease family protein [Acidimicrobiales bacterium]|nr:PD-(D/E)XK nuclease family protein [Acidimicrobiales bacterium]